MHPGCFSEANLTLFRTKQIFPVLGVLCLLGLDPALDVMTRFDIAETAELWACKAETTEAVRHLSFQTYVYLPFFGF